MPIRPSFIAPQSFTDAEQALAQVARIYEESIAHLRSAMRRFVEGEDVRERVRACYPLVRIHTDTVSRASTADIARLSFGFVAGPGRFETTLTRPDLYHDYYLTQFRLLLENHGVELEVCTSSQPIPVHFSFSEHDHVEGNMPAERRARMRDVFDLPDLAAMDDGIANGTHEPRAGEPQPLSLFTAPRVDYSLHRLRHYTGTLPEHFQNFVLFTNYQFYIDEFIALGRAAIQAPFIFKGAMTSAIFATYVEHVLAPTLQSGDIVVLDNLSAHKSPAIRTLLAAHGARLLFLAPYSADFNPIELAWAKTKTALRGTKARTLAILVNALAAALRSISVQDMQGWFKHCGYTV